MADSIEELRAQRDALLWCLTIRQLAIAPWAGNPVHVTGCDCEWSELTDPRCIDANTFRPALMAVDGNHGDQFIGYLPDPEQLREFGDQAERAGQVPDVRPALTAVEPDEITRVFDAHPDRADWGHTFIQWKGTKVCMDVFLPCGCSPHIDAEFAYFVRCECGQVWQVGSAVPLRPVTAEQLADWGVDNLVIAEDQPEVTGG